MPPIFKHHISVCIRVVLYFKFGNLSNAIGYMAPPGGLEPPTLRLTVECSTIELQGIATKEDRSYANTANSPLQHCLYLC